MRRVTVAASVLLAVGMAGMAGAAAAQETVTARAQVVNGDTLRLDGHAIRLWGIAVPEPNRPDGLRATIGLFRLIDGRIVSCHLNDGRDPHALYWGKCEAGGLDIGALMVDGGFARDCTAQSNARYHIQEQRAHAKGSDITATFALPATCDARQTARARKSPAG